MKLTDVKIGEEYAADYHGGRPSLYLARRVYRVRALELVKVPAGRRYRQGKFVETTTTAMKVVVVAAATERGWHQIKPIGTELTLTGRQFWWPWERHQQYLNQIDDADAARNAVLERIRNALGRLGLHDMRYMTVRGNEMAGSEVTVSGAELEKLAERADHLVELERLVAEGLDGGPDGWTDRGLMGAITAWAEAHDFSMLEDVDNAEVVREHFGIPEQET